MDERTKASANLNSITTAQLAQLVVLVASSYSGAKGARPKVTAKEFLPFPNWIPKHEEKDGPDESTKFILRELLHARKLPINVFSTLMGTKYNTHSV